MKEERVRSKERTLLFISTPRAKQNRTSGLAHAVLMGISLLRGGGFGG